MLTHLILVAYDVNKKKLINNPDYTSCYEFTEWKFLKDGNLATMHKQYNELHLKINL